VRVGHVWARFYSAFISPEIKLGVEFCKVARRAHHVGIAAFLLLYAAAVVVIALTITK